MLPPSPGSKNKPSKKSVKAGGFQRSTRCYIPDDRTLHSHYHGSLVPVALQISAEIIQNHSCCTVIIIITLNNSMTNWKTEMVQLSRKSKNLISGYVICYLKVSYFTPFSKSFRGVQSIYICILHLHAGCKVCIR
jgi:hypothetical protein